MAHYTIYHVLPHEGGSWEVRRERTRQSDSQHTRKAEAAQAALESARLNAPSLVRIHRRDGSVESEFRYAAETSQELQSVA